MMGSLKPAIEVPASGKCHMTYSLFGHIALRKGVKSKG
jgi:hypothetical protein